jgi:ABC-type nitrate/sulfonate/bicarbonate transport system ATPase subunit
MKPTERVLNPANIRWKHTEFVQALPVSPAGKAKLLAVVVGQLHPIDRSAAVSSARSGHRTHL